MKLAYTDDDWERAEYDYRCKKEERRVMDNSVEIYEAFAGDQLEEDERRIKGCIVSDIEREEFEQAVADKWSDSYKFTRFGDEDYYDEVLEGMWRGWQASRQALEGEPVGTARRCEYDRDITYCEFEADEVPICTKLYTHPASRQAVSVPKQWVDLMRELVKDLISEIKTKQKLKPDERVAEDLGAVREAIAMIAKQEQGHE